MLEQCQETFFSNIINKPYIFSGNYHDLINRPSFCNVVFTCNYYDLSNRPNVFSGDFDKLSNMPLSFTADWNTSLINKLVNYKSKTKINDGVKKFTKWFIEYYKHK